MSPPQESEDTDEDEMVVALQRDAELDADPSIGLTMDQFEAAIAR
jgi:hypothetical protein